MVFLFRIALRPSRDTSRKETERHGQREDATERDRHDNSDALIDPQNEAEALHYEATDHALVALKAA